MSPHGYPQLDLLNPDGTLAKVLAERRRGPVVAVEIAQSARHIAPAAHTL